MIIDRIHLLAKSLAIAEQIIAQISPDQPQQRSEIVRRYWETYSQMVSALMKRNRLYEAFVYSERAKALAFLPELDLEPPPSEPTEAIISIMKIIDILPDDNTALLTFFVGHQEAFAWVIRKGRRTISGKKMPWVGGGPITPYIGQQPLVTAIKQFLVHGYRGRFDTPSDIWVQLSGRNVTLKEALDWFKKYQSRDLDAKQRLFNGVGISNQVAAGMILYEILFKPAEHALEGMKRIVIIPDGPLHYLPFEALIKRQALGKYPQPSADTDFLVKEYVLSYLPSVYLLENSHGGSHDRYGRDASCHFVGFGNPMFSDSMLGILQAMGIGSIPSTEDEVKTIASMFSYQKGVASTSSKIFLGEDATKQRFFIEARAATYLHVATHGGPFFDDKSEAYSLLFSSNEKGPSFEEKAVLKSSDIINLRLNNELVVLSACRSGLGKYKPGEGLQGLAQAFRQAGAKALLVSLWNVADEKSIVFMKEFYHALLSGKSVAEACSYAKREMIKREPDPFYWAPFIAQSNVI